MTGEVEDLRRAGFAVAYRMLGTVGAAEDAVQEGLLRLHRAKAAGETIESERAYLATVVTRICIDELRSARARRETYPGEWLPEPLVAPAGADPAEHAEMADSLSVAFLVLLETLTPEQRAAFLLREVFDHPYDRIAEIVGTSEANARQLVARARRHVNDRRPRFETTRAQHERLARAFIAAVEEGDLPALEAVLAHDVELHGDGGGKVPALAKALRGRARVARTLSAWSKAGRRIGAKLVPVEVNGQPGTAVLSAGGEVLSVWAIEVDGGAVTAIRSVVNPEKLRHVVV